MLFSLGQQFYHSTLCIYIYIYIYMIWAIIFWEKPKKALDDGSKKCIYAFRIRCRKISKFCVCKIEQFSFAGPDFSSNVVMNAMQLFKSFLYIMRKKNRYYIDPKQKYWGMIILGSKHIDRSIYIYIYIYLQGYIPYPHIAAKCMFKLVVLLLPSHMRGSIGVHHLWTHPCFSSSSPEDLPEAMNDREKWRERGRDIRAGSTTWWWWIYIYKT